MEGHFTMSEKMMNTLIIAGITVAILAVLNRIPATAKYLAPILGIPVVAVNSAQKS